MFTFLPVLLDPAASAGVPFLGAIVVADSIPEAAASAAAAHPEFRILGLAQLFSVR